MARLNPVFSGIRTDEAVYDVATVKGVALKTFILLGIAVLSAFFSITYGAALIANNPGILFVAAIGAVICGILGQMNPNAAKVCGILYSVFEGMMLGLMSLLFEVVIGGIVLSAVLVTFTIFGVMLLLYTTDIIKVNGRFMKMMSTIGISILVMSLIYMISYLVNPNNMLIMALSNNPGLLIFVSLFILLYGAFMLAVDFEQVNITVSNGFDKKYEWTCALGLMVTIVWIYIEVLRLLAILSDRD
jgi:uncharacterized YccA/Bax inhibitor family protein